MTRRVIVEAASLESAQGFYEALGAVEAAIVATEGGYFSAVVGINSDAQISTIFDTLSQHEKDRGALGADPLLLSSPFDQ
jgi:hypothetical protein